MRDSGGTPLGDAFITVERQPGALDKPPQRGRLTYGDARGRPVLTDLDGTFEVTGLPDGLYTVQARQRQGGEAMQFDLRPGADVELVILDTGILSGVLTRTDGAPVTDYTITASLADERFEFRDRWREGAGDWIFEDVPPGRYTLSAEANGAAGTLEIELKPGETRHDLRIELAPRGE